MTTDVLDPYEELLCEAKKRQQVDDAELKLSHAKVRIISGRCLNGCESSQQLMQKSRGVSAFFGSLIRRTKYVSSFDEDTAATNGKNTYYNPEFVASLDIDETIFLLCHEACHDGFGHHAIIRGLDLEMANAAADLAVNSLLEAGGFKLIKGALRPSVPFEFRGQLAGHLIRCSRFGNTTKPCFRLFHHKLMEMATMETTDLLSRGTLGK